MKKILLFILLFFSGNLFSQTFYGNNKTRIELYYEKLNDQSKKDAEKDALKRIKEFILKKEEKKIYNKKKRKYLNSSIEIKPVYYRWDKNIYNLICRFKVNKDKLEDDYNNSLIEEKKIKSQEELKKLNPKYQINVISECIHNKYIYINFNYKKIDNKELINKIKIYSRLLEVHNDLNLYYVRGLLYFLKEDYQKAVNDFTSLIALKPNFDRKINMYRGMCYSFLGRHNDAIKEGESFLKFSPKNPFAHYTMGFAHYNKGDYFNSSRYADKASKLGDYNLFLLLLKNLKYKRNTTKLYSEN